ncbi:MAG: hypothetical protein R2794_02110 [Chitinophagales bacterium]
MITHKRQIFLEHFLGLYGVDRVEITRPTIHEIYGYAIYTDNDNRQEFCWHMSEEGVPTDDLIQLINVIKSNGFNQSDKIIVSANTIFEKSGWTDREIFNIAYDTLFEIEVKMIDDGIETDAYYLHN